MLMSHFSPRRSVCFLRIENWHAGQQAGAKLISKRSNLLLFHFFTRGSVYVDCHVDEIFRNIVSVT